MSEYFPRLIIARSLDQDHLADGLQSQFIFRCRKLGVLLGTLQLLHAKPIEHEVKSFYSRIPTRLEQFATPWPAAAFLVYAGLLQILEIHAGPKSFAP